MRKLKVASLPKARGRKLEVSPPGAKSKSVTPLLLFDRRFFLRLKLSLRFCGINIKSPLG